MNDWIGLAIILLLVLGVLFASAMLGRPPKRISEEEFEKRVREGQRSQAAVFALQQLMHPKAAQAVAVQQDLKYGYYNKKKIPGEGDEPDDTGAKTDQSDEATAEPGSATEL